MFVDPTADKNKRTIRNFLIITLNSTAYFLLSHLIVYLMGQFLTAISALQFNYKSVLYYYKLVWAIDSYDWTPMAVKLLFTLAPMLSLLLGIIFLIIYILVFDDRSNFKQLFLWGFAHGMVWFFGATLAGALLDQGFGYVIMYLYLKDTHKLVISLLALTALLLIAAFTTKWFLFAGNAYFNELNEHNRGFFTFSQIVVPAILGTAILILIKLPRITYYELFTLLTMLVFIIPMMTNYKNFHTFYFDEIPILVKADLKAILSAILLVAAFRMIFEFGIAIG